MGKGGGDEEEEEEGISALPGNSKSYWMVIISFSLGLGRPRLGIRGLFQRKANFCQHWNHHMFERLSISAIINNPLQKLKIFSF